MFSHFSKVQIFLIFCRKNLKIRAQNTFLGNNFIWYEFRSNFATFSEFEKKSCCFPENQVLREICYSLMEKINVHKS